MKHLKGRFLERTTLPEEYHASCFRLPDKINGLSEETSKILYEYMMKWPTVADWLSPAYDPLNAELKSPVVERSDGVFVWSDMHAHLVKTYRLKLPDEFISHVEHQIKANVTFETPTQDELIQMYEDDRQRFRTMASGKYADADIYSLTDPESMIIDYNEIFEKHSSRTSGR